MTDCAGCLKQLCQIQCREGINETCPMNDGDLFEKIQSEYKKEENERFYATSIESMKQSFAKLTRVMETVNFCKLMGYKKIGIAYCSGMIREGRITCEVFKQNGFEVASAGCKTGGFSPDDLIDSEYCFEHTEKNTRDFRSPDMQLHMPEKKPKRAICDPIGQAILLNKENTEFNVVVGLCVGHDSLFLKYADAPCSVLVAKDRMLCNNPAADLYFREANKEV